MIGYFILLMSRRIVQGKMNTGNYTLGYFHFFPLARSYPNAFPCGFFFTTTAERSKKGAQDISNALLCKEEEDRRSTYNIYNWDKRTTKKFWKKYKYSPSLFPPPSPSPSKKIIIISFFFSFVIL